MQRNIVITAIAAGLAASLTLFGCGEKPPPENERARAPAPAPKTKPAPPQRPPPSPKKPVVPPKKKPEPPPLAEACRVKARALRAKVGRAFNIVVEPPFVVAGPIAKKHLRYYVRRGVRKPAKAMWAGYFRKRPKHPIIILLFGKYAPYQVWAAKLFDDPVPPYFGYYKHSIRTMLMNIGPGIGTLYHELTHALIAVDFPKVPDWFNEGFGSLHEGAWVSKTRLVGVTNWRLPTLQRALRKKSLRSLRDLVTKDDFYVDGRGTNYAQARFFVQYLQENRLLKAFYRYFRENHTGPNAAVHAIEHVFGKKIDQVDAAFRAWARRLRYPRRS